MKFAGVDSPNESVRDRKPDTVLRHEDGCIAEIDGHALTGDCDCIGGQTTVASIEPSKKLAGEFTESELT
jgi:hypothetical protein